MRTIDGDRLRQEILDEFPTGSARGVFLEFVDYSPTVDVVGDILKKLTLEYKPILVDYEDLYWNRAIYKAIEIVKEVGGMNAEMEQSK